MAREVGVRVVVSKSGDCDILLVNSLNGVIEAKREGRSICIEVEVKSKEDENLIVSAAEAGADYILLRFSDWKIIPLENLIAKVHGKSRLLTLASNPQEARLALETLEIGADGVVADIPDIEEIKRIYEAIKGVRTRAEEAEAGILRLQPARIVGVKPLGAGARACIDTCDLMVEGEGMLVGCQSSGFFLVEAEVHETPFVTPRPFRVNAGSIALYIMAPEGKTRYLSELKAGDEILIVDRDGRSRVTSICRVKIEWRPLILLEAECEGRRIKTILQNAETIRVVTEEGSISVKDIKEGDVVLVHLGEAGGRHFGALVSEERVIER